MSNNRYLMSDSEIEFQEQGINPAFTIARKIRNPRGLRDMDLLRSVGPMTKAIEAIFQDVVATIEYLPNEDSNFVIELNGPSTSVHNCLRLLTSGAFTYSELNLNRMSDHLKGWIE